MKIHALWLSASVLALSWSGAAAAQTTSGNEDTTAQVQELVVTAERRASNLQTTAIAATVLTGEDLEKKGIVTVDQLQFAMPSLVVNNFGQGIDFNIRGIGKAEHNTQTTTGVITYRDDVATFAGYITQEPYYDLESLQVLRGPQGTFVGQNATGGAVFVTSRNPVIGGGYSGYVQGQLGSYANLAAQGGVNLPISDTFAARVSFYAERRDSFYDISGPWKGSDGDQQIGSLRLSLLWKPNDKLRVSFKTDYSYLDLGAYPADPVLSRNDPFEITANAKMLAWDQLVRSVLRVDYTFDSGIVLRSVSGFQQGHTAYKADLDGTRVGTLTFRDAVNERIYSQEFNLISPDTGPFTWILGAYYQHDKYIFPYGQFSIGLTGFHYDLDGVNSKEMGALFGQASFKLTPSLELQAGLRYSTSRTSNDVFVRLPEFFIVVPDHQTLKEEKPTGKIALNWTINPHHFVYAFAATGFRPGGLNVPGIDGVLPPVFYAESVKNFEVGWKAGWMGGHLRTAVDAYYNDYKNFQVIIGNPVNPVNSIELNNPSTTKMYGLEVQAEAVFGAFSFDMGLGLLHSELGTFYAVDPRVPALGACSRLTGPATASCINLSGHEQTYAPEFTFNFGAQYVFTLASGDTLTPRVNYGHVSDQWATLFENPARGDLLAPRDLFNAQLAWSHNGLVTTLYGTNISDQHYVGAINSGLRFAGPPRQYGVRVLKVF